MKCEMVAVPLYQDRISPLLDVSRRFKIYEISSGEIKQKITVNIHADSDCHMIDHLKKIGITMIICGAASCEISDLVREKKMSIISWINGEVDEVVADYIKGHINNNIKPDECGKRKKCRRRNGINNDKIKRTKG